MQTLLRCLCFGGALILAGFAENSSALAQGRTPAKAAKDPVESANLEFALSEEQLDGLREQTFDLLLKTGKKETGVTLKEFLRSKQFKDRFSTIEYIAAEQKRSRKIAAERVFQLEQGDVLYELAYLPTQRFYVLVDVAKRTEAVAAKLKASQQKFWDPLSEADRQKFVDEEKEFLKKVQTQFTALPLQLHETQYFLVLSDMPPAHVVPYVRQLDKMNEALGQSFGFAPGHNVWLGKAVILLFEKQSDFVVFESVIMTNSAPSGVQGLCHQFSNGRVVVACYRGDSPEFLGAVLVHETAHGYMHRYKSTTHIPVWLNEGIADWIAGVAVPTTPEVRRRQQEAAANLRMTGSFEKKFFEASTMERWQYGAASAIVQQMIQANPQLFQLFFNGIKEGLTWQDSLLRSYGMTPEELARAYGKTIGLPNLTP